MKKCFESITDLTVQGVLLHLPYYCLLPGLDSSTSLSAPQETPGPCCLARNATPASSPRAHPGTVLWGQHRGKRRKRESLPSLLGPRFCPSAAQATPTSCSPTAGAPAGPHRAGRAPRGTAGPAGAPLLRRRLLQRAAAPAPPSAPGPPHSPRQLRSVHLHGKKVQRHVTSCHVMSRHVTPAPATRRRAASRREARGRGYPRASPASSLPTPPLQPARAVPRRLAFRPTPPRPRGRRPPPRGAYSRNRAWPGQAPTSPLAATSRNRRCRPIARNARPAGSRRQPGPAAGDGEGKGGMCSASPRPGGYPRPQHHGSGLGRARGAPRSGTRRDAAASPGPFGRGRGKERGAALAAGRAGRQPVERPSFQPWPPRAGRSSPGWAAAARGLRWRRLRERRARCCRLPREAGVRWGGSNGCPRPLAGPP